MGDCSLDPKFGGGMVLGQCREDQASQAIVYAEVGPGNEEAWNADPAVNDSGLPYPPALPAHHEFNANAQPAPARQGIVYENVGPGNEVAWNADPAINDSGLPYPPALPVHHDNAKPTPARQEVAHADNPHPSFMSQASHMLLPLLGGGAALGGTITLLGGTPAVVAPLAVPVCLSWGAPLCLGALAAGGAGGATLAFMGDGIPLNQLSLNQVASGSVAALTGLAQGWSRAAQGFVHSGIYLSGTAFVVGRAGAFSAELAQTLDPLKAAKNTATDVVGMLIDLSAGSLGHQAGAALSNKRVRDAAPEFVKKLASQESKEVGNAVVRLPGLQSIMDEGRRLFGETGRNFMDVIQKFRFNFDDESAIRAVFKGSGVELREFTGKVVEWASSAQDKLKLWQLPFARESSVWNIAIATSEGLNNLAGVGRRVLRQEALSAALQREIPYSMRVEVPLDFNDVISGMRNLDKMLLSPEAKASPAWHDAVHLAKAELEQGFETVVLGEVNRLYGKLFVINRLPGETVGKFVEEVRSLQRVAEEFSDVLGRRGNAELQRIVREADAWEAATH